MVEPRFEETETNSHVSPFSFFLGILMLGFEAGYRGIYLLWHLIFALVSNDILGLASREKGEKKKKEAYVKRPGLI
jgi:hypothetical protein